MIEPIQDLSLWLCQVGLVKDNNHRDISRPELGDELLFKISPGSCLRDNHPQIRPVENLTGLMDAKLAEGAGIVNPCRVDE